MSLMLFPGALVSLILSLVNPSLIHKLKAKMLDGIMKNVDEALKDVKLELCSKLLEGKVLDLGAGSGGNMPYMSPSVTVGVTEYVTLEPNPYLLPMLEEQALRMRVEHPSFKSRLVTGYAEDLSAEYGSFDAVYLGHVLCEVPSQPQVLEQAYKLLKPGGRLVFFEHVRHKHSRWISLLQDVLNPVWQTFSVGCNVNRETVKSIKAQFDEVFVWELYQRWFPLVEMQQVGVALKSKN